MEGFGMFVRQLVHKNCWELLRRALAYIKDVEGLDGGVGLDAIVAVLLGKVDADFQKNGLNRTTVNVHGADKFWDSQWSGNQTSEAWYITDFAECPQAIKHILRTFGGEVVLSPLPSNFGGKMDNENSMINRLPMEIVMQLLCMLPAEDAVNFRVASKTAAAAPLMQDFWKSRIYLDVPWLWELQDSAVEGIRPDWRRIYQELVAKDPKDESLRAIRNRKRVWKTVVELAIECWASELAEREDGNFVKDWAESFDSIQFPLELR
jgi:hypothetical protein